LNKFKTVCCPILEFRAISMILGYFDTSSAIGPQRWRFLSDMSWSTRNKVAVCQETGFFRI